jgi:hypothetical protein
VHCLAELQTNRPNQPASCRAGRWAKYCLPSKAEPPTELEVAAQTLAAVPVSKYPLGVDRLAELSGL